MEILLGTALYLIGALSSAYLLIGLNRAEPDIDERVGIVMGSCIILCSWLGAAASGLIHIIIFIDTKNLTNRATSS